MLNGRIERLCYSVDDAATLMSVGKRSLYREIASGRIKVAKMGKRTLVPAGAIQDWLEAASKPAKLTKAAA
jgi:excisionase family DNA binding protein